MTTNNPPCPACHQAGHKSGQSNGVQRYKCINAECTRKKYTDRPKPIGKPSILGDRPLTSWEREQRKSPEARAADRVYRTEYQKKRRAEKKLLKGIDNTQ
jgi:hypothetical protein